MLWKHMQLTWYSLKAVKFMGDETLHIDGNDASHPGRQWVDNARELEGLKLALP
jgi:hypothetical protein